MIIGIEGDNGTGKTSLLVLISQDIKRQIWSNFTLKHPKYSELTLDKIIDLDNDSKPFLENEGLVLFIDEAYGFFESRLSNRSTNIYLSYKTNYQWRKRNLDVYLTFQDISSIDKRYRLRFDIIITCEYRKPFSKDDFVYNYYRKRKSGSSNIVYTLKIPYYQMSKIFDLYDTNEIVEPPNIELMTYKMAKNDPKLMKRMLNKYYDILLPQVEKLYSNGDFTHEKLGLLLTSNLILENYEKKLYAMLKNKIRL
jgi:hypothetical protein